MRKNNTQTAPRKTRGRPSAQRVNGKSKLNGNSTVLPSDDGHDLIDLDHADDLDPGFLDGEDFEDCDESITGGDDHIDDPVRIYLMQMGEIPLLTRREEVSAARSIERSRCSRSTPSRA